MLGQAVRCPLCGQAPDASGACQDCGQDLAPLAYFRSLPTVNYNRALDLAAAGNVDKAVRLLDAALAEDPELVDAWVVLGKLHGRAGRAGDARHAFAAALAVDPRHNGARVALTGMDAVETSDSALVRRGRTQRRWLVAGLAAVLVGLGVVAGLVVLQPWVVGIEASRESGAGPIETAQPGFLAISVRQGEVVLAGQVASESLRAELVTAVGTAAGGRSPIDAMIVDVAAGPVPGLDVRLVTDLVSALTAPPTGNRTVIFGGSQVVLAGAVADPAARAGLLEAVRRALPGVAVDGQLVVGEEVAEGGRVMELNAALAAVQSVNPISFSPQGADLPPQSAATVVLIAELLRGEGQVSVRIEGHAAQTSGSAENALLVSEQRAAAVRDALVAAGVDPATITARGLGDAFPLDSAPASRRAEVSVGAR